MDRDDSLAADVLRSFEQRADRDCITVLGRRGQAASYTGNHLRAAAGSLLERWEVWFGPGRHVFIVALPPGEAFLVPLMASLIGGHTLVPIAPPRPTDVPGRLRRMAQVCNATALLGTGLHRAAIEAQLQGPDGGSACPVVAGDEPGTPVGRCRPRGRGVPIIQHTSGSTLQPKAVPIHAAQIRANCGLIQRLWGMGPETVMVNWMPHYHDMGLMGGILYPLLSGGHSVQMSPFDMIRTPANWLRAISEHRATFSGGPAFAFQECLNRVSQEECVGLDLSSWQRAYCGAEPIPAGLFDRFRRRFAPHGLAGSAVFACYGMAEFTLFAAGEPGAASDDVAAAGSAATEPCFLSETTLRGIRITDPHSGAEVGAGREGEIWLSGSSLTGEYLGQDAATAETFVTDADGRRWLRTGDLGVVSGRRLTVTGRTKDIVIVHGRKVAAVEIEWTAAGVSPALNPLAAAAFVPPGAPGGHANLLIEVLPRATPPENSHAVIEQIRRVVAGTCSVVLDEIRILPRGALPRTTSGKIRRQQVAASSGGAMAGAAVEKVS